MIGSGSIVCMFAYGVLVLDLDIRIALQIQEDGACIFSVVAQALHCIT